MPGRVIVFLVDSSGSMDEQLEGRRKIERVCEAIFGLLSEDGRLSGDDVISLMLFHATKSGDVPKVDILLSPTRLSDLREDLDHLRKKMKKIKPMGGTPIGFALSRAVENLSAIAADEKRIILLTDGENNVGASPEEAAEEARSLGIRVDVVGIGDDVNPLELEAVAERTGGSFKHYPSDGELQKILEELVKAEPWVEEFEIGEKDELSRLLEEFKTVDDRLKDLSRKLEGGELGLDEYSRRASELEFRRRELVTKIRDIRSELSRRLLSAQMRLAELDRGGLEAEKLRSYVDELKRLLEESEIG